MVKKGALSPKKGMNRDSHPGELSSEEYSFALNTNFQDEHGNGRVLLQNEPSNIKCTGFKSGYKVIGHEFDINEDRTYFFLTNPTTGCSEIGYVDSISGTEGLEAVEKECGCDISVVIETPNQDQVQNLICTYNTLITDCCTDFPDAPKCLQFDVNFPIREGNIIIKDEKIGKKLYWTDNLNPQRHLNLDNIDFYYQDTNDCERAPVQTCLQCDKLRIFPEFDKPCINVVAEEFGGSLRAGAYEVLISYGSSEGDVISNWYSITNPITIHDKNNNILDQTNLDYTTSKSIKLSITDVDESYDYYNIAVVYRSGLDQSTTYKKYGTYPASAQTVSIIDLTDKEKTSIQDLLDKKPMYLKAEGLSTANGYLLHNGLTIQRELNLQPVVNLMGSLVKWSTVRATEDLYEDGTNVSNYTSYMRDEIVPLSVQFYMDGGYESPVFKLIPRPARAGEKDILGSVEFPKNINTDSVLESLDNCDEILRQERWQFENTAEVIGPCVVASTPGASTEEGIISEEGSCVVNVDGVPTVLDTVASGTVSVGNVADLVSYVNNNVDDIIASTDPALADIKDVLEDPTEYPESCTPDFGDNCDVPVLSSEQMVAIDVGSQETNEVLLEDINEYEEMGQPSSCQVHEADQTTGDPAEDTAFMSSWMRPSEIVFLRTDPYNNINCSSSTTLSAIPINLHLQNEGSNNITALQNTLNVSQVSLPEYTSNLHINALWYEVDFNGEDFAVVEISRMLCDNPDDNNNNSARVNVFGDCSATNDLAAYSTIINDMTTGSDPDKYLFLNAVDFPPGKAYIAIDSAMKREVDYELQLSGGSGEITVTIDGVNYSMPFNTDLATTASDFVTNHSAALLSNHNIIATAVGNNVSLRADRSYVALTSTTSVSANLAAAIVIVESYETLTPPCGCFSIRTLDPKIGYEITFTNLTFGKKQIYTSNCTFSTPIIKGCRPIPYEKGYFSYWESSEKYICNKELYDSSGLSIFESDLSSLDAIDKQDFENYYAPTTDSSGQYNLTADTNFMDQHIRHYKFPDSRVSPFMSNYEQKPQKFSDSVIYPIGFNINNKTVAAFLDVAVNNNLITLEERLKIRKYEVFRGDRRTDKSIIAKGVLFDNYKYFENGEISHYPNFPLNSLGLDKYNTVQHPFNNIGNNRFTFHSPETHFFKPTLPNEINVEAYVYGDSYSVFDTVEGHPTYVLLGEPAYTLATSLAIAEITLDILTQSLNWFIEAAAAGTPYNTVLAVAVAVGAVVALVAALLFKQGELKYKWLTVFRDLGDPQNFAYYSATVGKYNFLRPNNVLSSGYRGIQSSNYLSAGYWEVEEEFTNSSVNVNNLDREDSVFLSLGPEAYNINYPNYYVNYDNFDISEANSSRKLYGDNGEEGRSGKLLGKCASPYVGLKRYLPAQYGAVDSIEWVSTGYCGKLSNISDCDVIFGGDTFISRFSLKRKIPFFTQNAMGLAPLTPYKYSDHFNIETPGSGFTKYYLDYLTTNTGDFALLNLPQSKSEFNLYPEISDEPFYIKPSDGKFFLFSYGFPHFLVESQINCNYRYAKRGIAENFYPNFKDIIGNTQEEVVSIREPNTYHYNAVYSSAHTRSAFRLLPPNYSKTIYDRISEPGNSVIYSRKDGSETSIFDPWLSYRAVDAYDFPKSYGDLVSMDDLGSEQILGRFTNGITIFGALDMLADRIAPETKNIGTGGIFTGRNVNFNKTDLGYAGTQHTQMVNTDYGHFWVDAKRGKVFKLKPSGKGLGEITPGLEKWFKENLPFQILQSFPDVDIDNNYKGIGISMGWDDRLKRLFVTKLDYVYIGTDEVEYVEGDFVDAVTRDVIDIETSDYFTPCHWTVAYSPLTESWISYYSFKPNYYVNYHNYFQTGINTTGDTFGLWSHLSFLSSYQVFYGELYPFTIEYPNQTKLVSSILHDVEYYLDVRKYYNKYDYTDVYGSGFNKAVVYNNYQNTGLLNLVHQKENDMRQVLDYPSFNSDSIDILQSEIHNKWSFNYLYNAIKDEKAGLPIWLNDCPQIEKTLDGRLLNYKPSYKDRMRGDYFLIRLTQDMESRYKMIFRFALEERNYYEQ